MIGGIKALLDRLKGNVAFLQFPLLVYLSAINTLEYFFGGVVLTSGVVIFSLVVFMLVCMAMIYVDYKWVFPMEMSFMFRKTGHLERRFDAVEHGLDSLISSRC